MFSGCLFFFLSRNQREKKNGRVLNTKDMAVRRPECRRMGHKSPHLWTVGRLGPCCLKTVSRVTEHLHLLNITQDA